MIDVKLLGADELKQVFSNLEYKLQQKELKRILRGAGTNVARALRRASPKKSGTLSKSMGVVTGRNKRGATVFVGPRKGEYKGYIANVLEFGKNVTRVPKTKKALNTPWGPRRSVAGIKAQPFVKKTIEREMKNTEQYIEASMRKLIDKELSKAK